MSTMSTFEYIEYAGWGAGLFTEPALKVSFADGNRDLILHFVRVAASNSNSAEVLLKDISREIFVTLHYSMDQESGILARSASIENREKQPVMIEQAAFEIPSCARICRFKKRGRFDSTIKRIASVWIHLDLPNLLQRNV